MISLIAGLIFLILFGAIFGVFKLSNYVKNNNVNFKQVVKTILVVVGSFVIMVFQPMSIQRIEGGHVGLKIDRVGNEKGIPVARPVKGWVLYNNWATDVIEYNIRQVPVEYKDIEVPAKGGTLIPVSPSFNISLKPEAATEAFIHLSRSEEIIEDVKDTWLKTATNIALTNATNLFSPDSIFNNADKYRIEVEKELNRQLGKYFLVQQIKPGQRPPTSMVGILQAKANAVQAAQQAELNRQTAVATAEQKIAEARGDSAQLVINAKADAEAIRLKQNQITPQYIEFIRWSRWDGKLPTTSLGGNTSVLLNK
jgi:regulator of protease activity HflC (stomatin/prohibitin superfamily)